MGVGTVQRVLVKWGQKALLDVATKSLAPDAENSENTFPFESPHPHIFFFFSSFHSDSFVTLPLFNCLSTCPSVSVTDLGLAFIFSFKGWELPFPSSLTLEKHICYCFVNQQLSIPAIVYFRGDFGHWHSIPFVCEQCASLLEGGLQLPWVWQMSRDRWSSWEVSSLTHPAPVNFRLVLAHQRFSAKASSLSCGTRIPTLPQHPSSLPISESVLNEKAADTAKALGHNCGMGHWKYSDILKASYNLN